MSEKESEKKSSKEIILSILALIVSLGAVGFAWNANCISNEANTIAQNSNKITNEIFDWQKLQLEKEQLNDLQIRAYLEFKQIYLSELKEISLYERTSDISKKIGWQGLFLFVTVKLYNKSNHPISIDHIDVVQMLFGAWQTHLFSDQAYEEDYITIQESPFDIDAFKAKNIYVKIPWIIEKSLSDPLQQFEKNRLYNPWDMLMKYYSIVYPTVKLKSEYDDDGSTALMNLLDNQITEKYFFDDDPLRHLIARVHLSSDSLITSKIVYKLL